MSKMATTLKLFKEHLLPTEPCRIKLKQWDASRGLGDSESLKSFHSDIQDGCHGGHLENLELKLDGRHWGVMEIQNC